MVICKMYVINCSTVDRNRYLFVMENNNVIITTNGNITNKRKKCMLVFFVCAFVIHYSRTN